MDAVEAANPGQQFQVIVIGAGQAGLAAAHYLAEAGSRFIVLDAGAGVGDSWRSRWDSLKLFTPAEYNNLPGMPFPAPAGRLPGKDEMAAYLRAYAERFALPVRLNTRVDQLTREGQTYWVSAGGRQFFADHVVIASGVLQTPKVPAFAAALDPAINQMHSSEYRHPGPLQPGAALVVGAGSSGAEISRELAATRPTWLSGKPNVQLPRRLLGRDIFRWLWPVLSAVQRDSWLGRRIAVRMAKSGDPVIGISTRALVRSGVRLVPRIVGVEAGKPMTAGGQLLDVANVIWATGYHTDYRWVSLPIFDAGGGPIHQRGIVESEPGLYFVGLRFQHRLASHLVGGVTADARYITEVIRTRQPTAGAGRQA